MGLEGSGAPTVDGPASARLEDGRPAHVPAREPSALAPLLSELTHVNVVTRVVGPAAERGDRRSQKQPGSNRVLKHAWDRPLGTHADCLSGLAHGAVADGNLGTIPVGQDRKAKDVSAATHWGPVRADGAAPRERPSGARRSEEHRADAVASEPPADEFPHCTVKEIELAAVLNFKREAAPALTASGSGDASNPPVQFKQYLKMSVAPRPPHLLAEQTLKPRTNSRRIARVEGSRGRRLRMDSLRVAPARAAAHGRARPRISGGGGACPLRTCTNEPRTRFPYSMVAVGTFASSASTRVSLA